MIRLLNLGHAKYEVQNIQWMFVLHRPKRSVDSSDLSLRPAVNRFYAGMLSCGLDASINDRANQIGRAHV